MNLAMLSNLPVLALKVDLIFIRLHTNCTVLIQFQDTSCYIDGQFYESGESDSNNPLHVCDVRQSQYEWTDGKYSTIQNNVVI